MFHQRFISLVIGLAIFFLFPSLPSFTMEPEGADKQTPSLRTSLPQNWNEYDVVIGLTQSGTETDSDLTFRDDRSGTRCNFSDDTSNATPRILLDETISGTPRTLLDETPRGHDTKEAQVTSFHPIVTTDPMLRELNNRYSTAVIRFYPYPRDEFDKEGIAASRFLSSLENALFPLPRPVSKWAQFLKIGGGLFGLEAPFAMAPLVLVLSGSTLDFVPVGGRFSHFIFAWVVCTTGPPFAAQGVKFMEAIIDKYDFNDKNKLKSREVEQDNLPHTRPQKYLRGRQFISALSATLRTIPPLLLFWQAEKAFPMYGAFLSWPLGFYYWNKTYCDCMEFWNRLFTKREEAAEGISNYKRDEIKSDLKTTTDKINVVNDKDSDFFVEFLFTQLKEREEHKEAIEGKRARQVDIFFEGKINETEIQKAAHAYMCDVLRIKALPDSIRDNMNSSIKAFVTRACQRNKTHPKEFFAEHLVEFIHQEIQKYGRELRINAVLKIKDDFLKTVDLTAAKYHNEQNVLGIFSNKWYQVYSQLIETCFLNFATQKKFQTLRAQIAQNIRALTATPYLQHLQEIILRHQTGENQKQKAGQQLPSLIDGIRKALSEDLDDEAEKKHIQAVVAYLKTISDKSFGNKKEEDFQKEALNLIKSAINELFSKPQILNPTVRPHFLPGDEIYQYIGEKLGIKLSNGIAIPEEDMEIANFGLFLPKMVSAGYTDAKKKLNRALERLRLAKEIPFKPSRETSKGLSLQSETVQLLPENSQELHNLREAISDLDAIPGDQVAHLLKVLHRKKTHSRFQEKFLNNLAIFQQGSAVPGRFLISLWGMNKILGVGPTTPHPLSLTVASFDAVLRIQEWYLQKDTFLRVQNLSSPFKHKHWPLTWTENITSAVSASFFTLPAVAIISEVLADASLYTKILVIGLTWPSEFVSSFHFLTGHWDEVGKRLSSAWAYWRGESLDSKRAWLNDILDSSVIKVDELDARTIERLYNYYKNPD